MNQVQFYLKFICLMKNFKEVKKKYKSACYLKEYHILTFSLSIDHEKRKEMYYIPFYLFFLLLFLKKLHFPFVFKNR